MNGEIDRNKDLPDAERVGVLKGYDGLIDGNFIPLNRRSVSGIINVGGTILKTSRKEVPKEV